MESPMPPKPFKPYRWCLPIAAFALLAACSFEPPQPPPPKPTEAQIMQEATQKRLDAMDKAAAQQYRQLNQQATERAYANGVRDTLEEFKMRMQGREDFIYQPPVIDYVQVPARVTNGAFVPAHVEPVIVTPGRWVEENSVMLPAPNKINAPNNGGHEDQP